MSTWITGIAASSGIAIGKAYRLVEPDLSFQKTTVEDSEKEISRFRDSLRIAKSQLEAIRDHAGKL